MTTLMLRYSRRAALAAFILTISLSAALCQAQDSVSSLPQSVQRYVDTKTAVVGWVDISRVDLDGINEFNGKVSGAQQKMDEAKSTRDALVQLGVTRIFWVSDLAGLMSGPQVVIAPVANKKQDVVAVILKAVAGDRNGTAVIDGDAVLVGNQEAIRLLQQKKEGAPSPDLLEAVNRVQEPHGLVIVTPVAAVLPVVGLLPQLVDGDAAKATKAAEVLMNLKSVTLSGQLPPSAATLRIATKSPEIAQELTSLVNEWTSAEIGASAKVLQMAVDGDRSALNITSMDQAIEAIAAIQQLSTGNKQPNSMNSMRQIALAMHNFHDVFGHFPPQALADANGKRLLSWRVMLLPYLDQYPLYQEFHLDEPWDSEHNSKLISRMPDIFKSQSLPVEKNEAAKTRFLAPLTKDSLFGRVGPGVRLQDITDGTSNTLMVVEASPDKAVVWTKPEDLTMDDARLLHSIIAEDADGFTACLCDGAARFFSKLIDPVTLKALLSINGGEPIDQSKLE